MKKAPANLLLGIALLIILPTSTLAAIESETDTSSTLSDTLSELAELVELVETVEKKVETAIVSQKVNDEKKIEKQESTIEVIKPKITVAAEVIGGDLEVSQLRFFRSYCNVPGDNTPENIFAITQGSEVIVDACYQEGIEDGAFQSITPINTFFFDEESIEEENAGFLDASKYKKTVSGINCDPSGTYNVTEGSGDTKPSDAYCKFTFTHIGDDKSEIEEAEEIEVEEVVTEKESADVQQEEKETLVETAEENTKEDAAISEKEESEKTQEDAESSVPVLDNALAPTKKIGSGYTLKASINELDGMLKSIPVDAGSVADVEVTITNDSGPEDLVLYMFIAKVNDPTNPEDEGVFTTDHYFVDQKIKTGTSKTFNFPWLNDEESGYYRLFAEIKRIDWSGEPLQKEQIAFIHVPESSEPQSVGAKTHRFWSDLYKGHFYTISQEEAQRIRENDKNWIYEGAGDKTVIIDTIASENITALGLLPVYRFWSETYKHHFYTMSKSEKELIQEKDENWAYEHIAYYAYSKQQMDTTPVYRFYSDAYKGHFYTSSQTEKESLEDNDKNWTYEGIAWYVQK